MRAFGAQDACDRWYRRGVARPAVSRYERSIYRPRPPLLRRLATLFAVDEAELARPTGYR